MQEVDNSGGKSVEVAGEYELTLRLSEAYYPFLVELGVTRPFRFISPKCFIDGTTKNGVSDIVGTGSYVLSENHVDEYSIFKVNEDYWGEKPEIKEIEVNIAYRWFLGLSLEDPVPHFSTFGKNSVADQYYLTQNHLT